MARTFRSAVFGGSALALVTLGLVLRHAATGDETPSRSMSSAPSAVTAAPAKAAQRAVVVRQWPVGSAFVYEVSSSRTLTHVENGTGATGPALTIAGELAVAVVEAGSEAIRLRFELRHAQYKNAGDAWASGAELERAFYADAEWDGHYKGFAFQPGISSEVRSELKAIAEALQLVDSPLAATWKATELDGTGQYAASYERSGDTVRKSKERYLRTLGPNGLSPLRDSKLLAIRSQADFTLARTGWPASVALDETINVNAGSLLLTGQRRLKARLARVEKLRDLAALAAAEASLVPDAVDLEGFASVKRRVDENRVGGATFETVLGGLRSGDMHAQNNAMSQAAALFRVQPQEAKKAADSVLHGDLDEDAKQRLLGALSGAGTKEAQAALASVLAESSGASAETRASAAAALGMTAEPTAESEDALLSAMDSTDEDVASTAKLGAGNLAQTMNSADGQHSRAVEALVAKLSAATTDDERRICLQALGNTEDPEALAAIEKYLTYPILPVREAAVFALRFMTGGNVETELVIAMKDVEPTIRQAAVSTLSFRPISPMLETVNGLLRADPNETVRLDIVNAMRVRRREEPALVDSLQWAASQDPSEEVQNAAKSALQES